MTTNVGSNVRAAFAAGMAHCDVYDIPWSFLTVELIFAKVHLHVPQLQRK